MASPPSGSETEVGSFEAPELSVIVPCLNEELNLPELTARTLQIFARGGFRGELVIVDDGSTDHTPDVVRALMAAHPGEVVGVFHPKNRGTAAGWKSGTLAARGRLVATIDADLQYQPEDLLRLRRALYEHSVDVAQGYRSPLGRRRDERYTLSRGFNSLLNGVFSMHLRDNKSGFVMCGREVLLDLLSYTGNYYYWQSFIMIAAHAKGYSYREVETLFEQRRAGESFLAGSNALKASARSLVDLGRATWEYRIRRVPSDAALRRLQSHPSPPHEAAPRTPVAEARFRAYMATFNQTHFMLTSEVEHQVESLAKTQWLPRADLEELADEKLRRLVRHAYRNVPFYRASMQAKGLRPEDIRSRVDLDKLPLLTKANVTQHRYFDILSENHDKDEVLPISTSGANGEPFVAFADRAQLELRWAAKLRSEEWTGYRFGDLVARLWDPVLSVTPPHELRDRAEARLAHRLQLPLFELREADLKSVVETLTRSRPVLLEGYAEALDLIARYVLASGGARPAVGAVSSYGQTLTDASRQRIEAAFGCRVFDEYGTRELGTVAHECDAHAGHHVVSEGYIVEVLRDGRAARPGELGEIVVTDLTNYCMPFLRYRTGDWAVAIDPDEPCRCGRASPRIGAIEGRAQAIVVGRGGRYVPGTFFAQSLRDLDYAIQHFQVIQEREGAIRFRMSRGGRYSPEVLAEVLEKFRQRLGRDLEIEVELVDDSVMAGTPGFRAVSSTLEIDFQEGRRDPPAARRFATLRPPKAP